MVKLEPGQYEVIEEVELAEDEVVELVPKLEPGGVVVVAGVTDDILDDVVPAMEVAVVDPELVPGADVEELDIVLLTALLVVVIEVVVTELLPETDDVVTTVEVVVIVLEFCVDEVVLVVAPGLSVI